MLFGEDTLLDMVQLDQEDGDGQGQGHKQGRAQVRQTRQDSFDGNGGGGGFIPASQVKIATTERKQDQSDREDKENLLLESSHREQQMSDSDRTPSSRVIKRRRGSNKVTVTSYHENSTMAEDRTLDSQVGKKN